MLLLWRTCMTGISGENALTADKSLNSLLNNIHAKISPCWLAESMSFNPKQCKSLKFFECRETKLVQKVEIERESLKLNWLTGKSRKRNSQMANQMFCFQIKHTPWMALFIAQFFPDCVIRMRSFCSTISKCFQRPQILLVWKNLLVFIYSKFHSKSFDYLYKFFTPNKMFFNLHLIRRILGDKSWKES